MLLETIHVMKDANGVMTIMDVQVNVITGTIFMTLTSALRVLSIALNKKETFVLNAKSQLIGRVGTGSFVPNVIRIVKFVMKILLIAIHVEKAIGLIIRQNDVQMNGQVIWSAIQLKIALKCQKTVQLFNENVKV